MTVNELRKKVLELSIQVLELLISCTPTSTKPSTKSSKASPKESKLDSMRKSGRKIGGRSLSTSAKGVDAIKTFEGYREVPYEDAIGVLTVGYGHTGKVFKRLTKEEAEDLLIEDIKECEACIKKHVNKSLLQHEFDALVSLIYNIGTTAFKKSTLLRKLNEGLKFDAANEFLRWDKAKDQRLNALVKRRRSERRMFLAGEYRGYDV